MLNHNNDRAILRARWHDYSKPGFYMITMVTNDRQRALGTLTGDSEDTAHIVLSHVGEALEKDILDQQRRHPEIEIQRYVIMEDHCHLLVRVKEEMHQRDRDGILKYDGAGNMMAEHLGKVVWGMKYGTTVAYLRSLDDSDGMVHRLEKRRLVRGGASASVGDDGVVNVPALWSEGYHDRVVTKKGQVTRLKQYISRNPARLWLKRHSPDGMVRVADCHIAMSLPMAQQLKDAAIYWDQRRDVYKSPFSHSYDNAHYAESYVQLVQHFLRRDRNGDAVFMRVRTCGDMELLYSGRPLVRVRMSRSITEKQFMEESRRILDLCEREKAIAVSPFRSWSEKAMLRMLRMNGYHHVIIYGEGMWEGWKPQDGSTAQHQQTVPAWYSERYSWLMENTIPHNIAHSGGHTARNMDVSGAAVSGATNGGAAVSGAAISGAAVSGDLVRGGVSASDGGSHIDYGDMREVYDGRCLFISLWPDRPRGMKAGKADCEVMNEVSKIMENISYL